MQSHLAEDYSLFFAKKINARATSKIYLTQTIKNIKKLVKVQFLEN